MFDKIFFSERLRKIREEKGWTQKEAAEKCGIVPSTYSAYENKKNAKIPPLDIAIQIADGFETSLSYLCGTDNEAENEKKAIEISSYGDVAQALIEICNSIDCFITPKRLKEPNCDFKSKGCVDIRIFSNSLFDFFTDMQRLKSVLIKKGDAAIYRTWEKARMEELKRLDKNDTQIKEKEVEFEDDLPF